MFAALPVKNWKILLKQSLSARNHMPLLAATVAHTDWGEDAV